MTIPRARDSQKTQDGQKVATSASSRVLIVDDDPMHNMLLRSMLGRWGFEIEVHADGGSAWDVLQQADPPRLIILDWIMPQLDGLELCRRVRALRGNEPTYILMVTGRDNREDLVAALDAGADDYVSKPADKNELRARVMNGVRMIELQLSLRQRIRELEAAVAKVKVLQGLLPICAYCKSVRSDNNYWQQVEAYFAAHSDVRFSHGICPGCFETIVEPKLRELGRDRGHGEDEES